MPRRTLYLMSARTGANTSDFGRLFDRADPSLIVAQRGQSVVAPQALFFLNDPFVSELAKALAARVVREAPANHRGPHPASVRPRAGSSAHEGRDRPRGATAGLADVAGSPTLLERYLPCWSSCTNEFLYID